MKNNTNATKKATATNTKETKTMKNTKSKEVKLTTTEKATRNALNKAIENGKATATETKSEVVKTETTNTEKVNKMLNIQEITELYAEAGIKCYNPTAKGNYRIMGFKGGSSLNIVPKRGEYRIYSTDTDYDIVNQAGLKFEDLVIEKGTNSVDKARQNTIICKTIETLKGLLGVYATNPMNTLNKTA